MEGRPLRFRVMEPRSRVRVAEQAARKRARRKGGRRTKGSLSWVGDAPLPLRPGPRGRPRARLGASRLMVGKGALAGGSREASSGGGPPLKGGGLWGLLSQPLGPCRGDGQGREGPRGLVGLGLRLRRGGDPHPEAPGGKPKAEAFPPGGRPRPHQPHGLQQPGGGGGRQAPKALPPEGLPCPLGSTWGRTGTRPWGGRRRTT